MRELSQNRPVHLAGRDANYEQAVAFLQGDLMNHGARERLDKCRAVTTLLELAHQHGDFALRGMTSNHEENLFVEFLALLLDSAQSLQVLANHEVLLMSDREVLREFLTSNEEMLDRSATEHRLLAEKLLMETLQLIQMAGAATARLKQNNLRELENDEARARYNRAYASFRKQTH